MVDSMQWNWFSWGKHPALEDFVSAGTQTPLFQRFTKWVDNGFARLRENSMLRSRSCSWRFWTRGTGRKVVCGLIRNSCDVYGRSFPLLYLGAGGLEGWSRNCTMLPLAFESIWKSIEYIASSRFDGVGQLNESLQLIERPVSDWRNYRQRIYEASFALKTAKSEETVEGGRRLLKVNCGQPENLPLDFQFCRRVMSIRDDRSPMAVFVGEIDGNIAVAIINNALISDDFVWLWRIGQNSRKSWIDRKDKG